MRGLRHFPYLSKRLRDPVAQLGKPSAQLVQLGTAHALAVEPCFEAVAFLPRLDLSCHAIVFRLQIGDRTFRLANLPGRLHLVINEASAHEREKIVR